MSDVPVSVSVTGASRPVSGSRSALPVLLLAALAAGCSQEVQSAPDDEPSDTPHRALAIEGSEARPDPPPGGPDAGYRTHLYSERDADVYAQLDPDQVSGAGLPVETIEVEIGTRVGKGQLLATLQGDEARLAVASARPEAEEARATFERVRALHERGVVTDAEDEAALFAKQRFEAKLERAELALERTRIRAPFAGVVSKRYVRVGQHVNDEVPLFRVTDPSRLRARLLVPEELGGAFRRGARVQVRGMAGITGIARVLLIGPTVDPASGTREVILELERGSDLEPGVAVSVLPAMEAEGPELGGTRPGGAREEAPGALGSEASSDSGGEPRPPGAPPGSSPDAGETP